MGPLPRGGGGVREGLLGGGVPKAKRCPSQAPLTSPCPPSNHTIRVRVRVTELVEPVLVL